MATVFAGKSLLLAAAAGALMGAGPYPVRVEKNIPIPMRDGAVMRADVYRPDAPGRFPALLKRTPYSKAASSEIPFFRHLASEGFAVVVSDTRGRYMSDGVARPHDEADDGHDTVEQVAKLPYVDGKVGMFGGSYAATTQLMAASTAPEGLVALFPSSSYASRYDMVFQGGAFYLSDGLSWNLGQAVDVRRRLLEPGADRDGPIGLSDAEAALVQERYVWHLPLKSMNLDDLRAYAPGYFQMLDHPSFDEFWRTFDIASRHTAFQTPALHITGWYDSLLEGTLRNFEGLRAQAATPTARTGQRLIVGPWTHARPSADSTRIGDISFGPDAGLDSRALMEDWFRYWLGGESNGNGVLDGAPVKLFVMGVNRWRDEESWPLERAVPTPFYLREGFALSPEAPVSESSDGYVYDPWRPVPTPTAGGYSRAPMDTTWLETRDDVLAYTSPPLDEPLEVTGYVELVLWVSSSARDTDFTGRLLDVAPDGTSRSLNDGILRLRYRNGFEKPELLPPDTPVEIRVQLGATSNVFLPGHRIKVQLSSSNFPRFDRNPNTGGVFGEDTELLSARQTIFHERKRASRLVLPVVPVSDSEPRVPIGFTAEAARELAAVEDRFVSGISAERISAFHRKLTERPHRAGTAGGAAVADYIADSLRDSGLEVEVLEYDVHLSGPRRVAVEIVSPEPEALATTEPADPRDPQSEHPELEPGFIAYSPSGTVDGEVVYAGYGLPADYQSLGLEDVSGKIVLARYGRSHRAVKVATAEEKGAAAVLLYSDPEDDGAGKGAVWPDGMWRAPHQLQRGNAKRGWFWQGDPLTPGVPALDGAPQLDPGSVPTLPRIPSVPLAASEAAKIFDRLGKGRAVRVKVDVEMEEGLMPIQNVVATLKGREEPDRWVLLGTHHDAWTFGGVDPGSATAVLMEVARGLADLSARGIRPARSVVFCFWDAEEYGLVGSTEFAEDRAKELREKAVVYLNTDMYNGTRLEAGGTPSLRDFVREVVDDVPGVSPPEELKALGSGADFVPFQDFVGLPTLSLEFLGDNGWGFGTYHSNYDDRYWMERHADTEFRQGAVLARLLGTTALRLAEAPVLPYRFSYYASQMASYVRLAEEWAGGERFEDLRSLAAAIEAKSARLEARIDGALSNGRVFDVNDGLMRLEHALVDETEPPAERWYRHVVYGWNIYALYSGQPFPGLAAAIERGDDAAAARERERIRAAFERVSRGLDELLGGLP